MYRKPSPQMTIEDFILLFAGKLAADNRWVKLAAIIPWDEIEKQYAFMFPSERGNVAKPVRMALGALVIQARCGIYRPGDRPANHRESVFAVLHRLKRVPVDQAFYTGSHGQV